ncbi:C-type lectin domain and von Willebrand factor, type A domain and C-type lectin-like domain and C-type lectin fold domain-containing protein [Strongyloides ratti]|uniref:C-type lectin domain and von Willebrand factor, type A domain and C-type lectin-like domain and C-type lectin fold domain-containing protein n=1 Tax=Strongyloides ratti TaxID=34506 RepID=A0A090LL41_STRRB|nr:C-type lectin domain and von Willebrand factor, type A domain and C-type lectin-like domain and C-type lectin fold domain-containing protein [Strongyloides ratti]CEF68893.1 C-type lectin domain and von Willebrand factor, type A domain and C-type lectin-like domain and C-type lectin fold domain-containing protein [Strongyloides ratti]
MKIVTNLLLIFIIFVSQKLVLSFEDSEDTYLKTKSFNTIGTRNCTSITNGNAYLDIVVVFDTSKGVDELGFNGEKGSLITILSALKIGQGAKSQISRLSIITAAAEAKIISDLNKYSSTNDAVRDIMQIQFSSNTNEEFDTEKALKAAEKVIETTGRGDNFKKVILLYTSATDYDCSEEQVFAVSDESPCRTAANLKNKGYYIITAALQFKDGVYNPPAKSIASPCFAVTVKNLPNQFVEMFTYANCFCESVFLQYFNADTCYKAAECLYLENTPTGYTMAQKVASLANGTLVDIRDEQKENFIIKIANYSLPVFIGLNQLKTLGKWTWDTGYAFDNSYNKFSNGEENKKGMCVTLNSDGLWYTTDCSPYLNPKPYIYQVNACDAGNFCAGDT